MKIIVMRLLEYGSQDLSGKFYSEIAKELCIRLRTVISVCRRYVERGCILYVNRNERRTYKKKLSPEAR